MLDQRTSTGGAPTVQEVRASEAAARAAEARERAEKEKRAAQEAKQAQEMAAMDYKQQQEMKARAEHLRKQRDLLLAQRKKARAFISCCCL